MSNRDQESYDSNKQGNNAATAQANAEKEKVEASLEEEITSAGQKTAPSSSLLKELEEAKQKSEENWNLFLRTRADMDNIRRRAQIDVDGARKYAIEKFARELLAVVDSLEHGLSVAESAGDAAYKEGMALTIKLLLDIFDKFDIKRVYPQGEIFDPSKHEAISMLESADAPPNTILVVAQAGFILNDRVLRPARVVVAKAPEVAEQQ